MKKPMLFKRLGAESPSFFKKITNIGIALGAVGAAILASPIALPAAIVSAGGYLIAVGGVAAAIAKTTVADPTILEEEK